MALLKAFGYWLQRFELNFSARGTVQGASYTDVKAQLPALNMLIVISIAAAALFFVNRWLKGWVLPIIAVGLWSFVSVVIGSIYPTIVQKASVEPNELQKESKYIQRNIDATRSAFGLNKVTVKDFSYKEDLAAGAIRANEGTIDDIRLWDPHILNEAYTPLQQIRSQYTFGDVDIDRYRINGEMRQVLIVGPGDRPRAASQPDVAEPPPRLHPRLRRRGLTVERGHQGRGPGVPPQGHPAPGNGHRGHPAVDLLRREPPRLRLREHQAEGVRLPDREGTDATPSTPGRAG